MPSTKATAINATGRMVKKSRAYRYALARASSLIKNPARLNQLVSQALPKAEKTNISPLVSLRALLRLVKAYSQGEYRELSWYNLMLIVAAIVYFVIPVDMIPDIIAGFGYIDDALLIAWTASTAQEEIEQFVQWEKQQRS